MRIDDLANAVYEEIKNYSEEVEEKVFSELDTVSEKLVNRLKNNPVIPVKTGKYKKSFYAKTVAKGIGFKRNVVANKKYQLTHLLERGHATGGGTGRTKAYPHWEDAQEELDRLTEEVLDKL